jgi:hypothetical protein
MTRAVVNPGICGMTATIEVVKVGNRKFSVEVTSDCEMVSKLAKSLVELDQRDALKLPLDSDVYKYATQCRVHASCPMPMAIIKTIEIEAGLALPRPISVHFDTVE